MALPVISGEKVREILLHCGDDGHDKEYMITITRDAIGAYRVFYSHGPSGRMNNGGEKTPRPVMQGKAHRIADELVDAKRNSRRSPYTVTYDHSYDPGTTASSAAAASSSPRKKRNPTTTVASLTPASRAKLAPIF